MIAALTTLEVVGWLLISVILGVTLPGYVYYGAKALHRKWHKDDER